MTLYYTGVGSRDINPIEKDIIKRIASHLAYKGYRLRSGKADGSDAAFASGALMNENYDDAIDNFTPWSNYKTKEFQHDGFDIPLDSMDEELIKFCFETAARIHPAWHRCKSGAKKLHARNILQVLGYDTQPISSFLLACSNEDGKGDVVGGTRTAWMLGKERGVPLLNIRGKTYEEVENWVNERINSNLFS